VPFNFQPIGDSGCDIGESLANAQRFALSQTRRPNQKRHIFAAVVGAGSRRVIAVVSGDDEQIALPQFRQEVAKPLVKLSQRLCETLRVVSVTVNGVKVNEGAPKEIKIALRGQCFNLLHAVSVIGSVNGESHAPTGENVVNLPNRDNFQPCFCQGIKERRDRVVGLKNLFGAAVRLKLPGVPMNGRAITLATSCSPLKISRAILHHS
jgi:hypothetical protein